MFSCAKGQKLLKARDGIQFSRGEDTNLDNLKMTFDHYCPVKNTPYEENPFFTCVERAGLFTDGSCIELQRLVIKLEAETLELYVH